MKSIGWIYRVVVLVSILGVLALGSFTFSSSRQASAQGDFPPAIPSVIVVVELPSMRASPMRFKEHSRNAERLLEFFVLLSDTYPGGDRTEAQQRRQT